MRDIYVFIIILIVSTVTSCVRTDEGPIDLYYKYVNKSSYDVWLEVYSEYDKISPNNATIVKDDSVTITYTVPAPPDDLFFLDSYFVVSFKFLSDPEKCLTYSGTIVDSLDDPRSTMALEPVPAYVYIIDDSLLFKADTCQ